MTPDDVHGPSDPGAPARSELAAPVRSELRDPPGLEPAPPQGPPSLATARRARRAKVVGVGVVALALLVPGYLALGTEVGPRAGITGFLALFTASLSLLVAVLGRVLARERPRSLGVAGLAAGLGAAALLVGGLGARLAIRSARLDEIDDPSITAAWTAAVAVADARVGAWLSLSGLLGAGLGVFGLSRAARARRAALAEATHLAAGSAPAEVVTPRQIVGAHAATGAAVLGTLLALAVDVSLLAEFHAVPPHPHEGRLQDVAALSRLGESDALCAALEEVLAPDYAPLELLDRELPAREELAHRCILRGIDALPQGLRCLAEAGVLSQSHTAKLIGAEDRVIAACKRALAP